MGHLGDELQGDHKRLFHSRQFQSLQFRERLPQSCHDYLARLENVPESHKSHRCVGQILLCCREVVALSLARDPVATFAPLF
ncbi:unknown protein [Microcystis aeruginosa NIES-843]|uniref:Uncharacterized protein n=1 Tax=Microcystis aeruginosa (strain NIES-843 / IAM M-2473) TaxID=449447 RepID=B0JIM7_MICAN|nr:unknown protein [Microcystis aeruginosa NIES-843]